MTAPDPDTTPVLRARRHALARLAALLASPAVAAQSTAPRHTDTPRYAPVVPGYEIRFPQDEGSHPAFRTEWWYVTGWLERANRSRLGFQITFFRARAEVDAANPSAFTPRQLVIAHAALSDASDGRLVSDQKLARAGFDLAGAAEERLHVWIDRWSLARERDAYRLRVPAREFAMDFEFAPTQPPLLQGEDGYSRKGPRPESASYYYSLPQLKVSGTLMRKDARSRVSGHAWLDHEWSSSYMDERASGWDWVGLNLADGSALMAFRMRDRAGNRFWASATYRGAGGVRRTYAPGEVEFTPLRAWRSPRTGTSYPVAWRIRAGTLELAIEPLMEDQEHDTRASVGTIYWEGAVTASLHGNVVGRGYLELTGYWRAMKL